MEKIVMTRGRYEDNYVLKHIPKKLLSQITICCHVGEKVHYEKLYGGIVKDIKEYIGNNVGEARHWCIMDSKEESVLFIEDNIHFISRGLKSQTEKNNKNNLYKITTDFFNEASRELLIQSIFNDVEKKVGSEGYSLVGLSARGGNNHVKEDFQDNCRIYGCWAINVKDYKSIKENLSDVRYREDFYIILCLIRNGFKVGAFFKWAMDKYPGIGSDGGCSAYRNQEGTDENAEWMAKEFDPFVKVAIKERSWKGYIGEVKDVRIYWKKMYQHYQSLK